MPHVRQQTREAVATVLNGSVAGLWRHVFSSRIKPRRDVVPYLIVYNESEDVSNIGNFTRRQMDRRVNVIIKGFLKLTDDEAIENTADAMSVEIEDLLTFDNVNAALPGRLQGLQLQSAAMEIEVDDTERAEAVLTLDYELRIFSVEGDAQTII